ncbi:MAG: cysteine desulfurase family protein [Synechococcus sp. WH 8007]|nr:cysteine desulfurase family protein [Synechococcus sp. WH 8007]
MASGVTYLDYQSTTPCDPAVVQAMAPWWTEDFANPASRLHRPGLTAAAVVQHSRSTIAASLGFGPEALIFCSGASEANNLAIKGVAEAELRRGGSRRRLICLATEHRAVLDPMRYLAGHGFELICLAPQADGRIDLNQLEEALSAETLLVSVMAANNEIGVLQPMEAIVQLCHERQVLIHCDGAQAVGHVPLPSGLDLLSLSGHKLYGPKGIGALAIRPGVELAPQQHGGSQERGLRAGTLPVPLIVGLAQAVELAEADRDSRGPRLAQLRDALWERCQALGGIERNGSATQCLPHNLNITIQGVEGTALHQALRRNLAVSSGSACAAGEPSHVLQALGRSRLEAAASVRFSLGRASTRTDVERAGDVLEDTLKILRRT